MELIYRPRRLRSEKISEKWLGNQADEAFVYPMFVMDGDNKVEAIEAMPGQFRYTVHLY